VQADEWNQATATSSQAFVAMWLDDRMNAAWADGLQKAVTLFGC
jgi:hypothetical protein